MHTLFDESSTLQFSNIVRESEKSWFVDFFGLGVWLPKSRCEIVDWTYSLIEVPNWLIREKGLEHAHIDPPKKEKKNVGLSKDGEPMFIF